MRQINLLSVPNQAFTVTLNNRSWSIAIKKAVNCMFADISVNNETILKGQRVLPNQLVIPYKFLSLGGNFVLTTMNDELPDYQRFGIDQEFYYLTPEEIGIND